MHGPSALLTPILFCAALLGQAACAMPTPGVPATPRPSAASPSDPAAMVGGPAQWAAAALARCGALGFDARVACYHEALLAVLGSAGIRPAMQTLEIVATRDGDAHHFGHVLAHHIGIAGYESPDRVGAAFAECTPGFQSGCYHGVVQAYFADPRASGADGRVDAARLNRLCSDHRGDGGDRWLLFQCVHGIGHGLVALHDFHLPRALESCGLLEDAWEREGCYGGAFMENIVSATMPHHAPQADHLAASRGTAIQPHVHAAPATDAAHRHHEDHGHGQGHDPATAHAESAFQPLDPTDPHHPCSALDERYVYACYTMQTSAVLFRSGGDISAGVRLCEEAPERVRDVCYVSLGRDIIAYGRHDHARAIRDCMTVALQHQPACVVGVAKNLIDVSADPADGVEFCRELPAGLNRERCFQAVGEQIAFLAADPARRAALCLSLDGADERACRSGAGIADPAAGGTEPQP